MLTPIGKHPAEVLPRLTRALLGLWLQFAASLVLAVQLPAPEILERDFNLSRRTVAVAEPHTSTPEQAVKVAYVGLPMEVLLNGWFGERWKAPDVEVVFFALDGYRSAIPASKLSSLPAFLAFARADGGPFVLENREQREKATLGPYYLIWDNLKVPELRRLGSSGWPYQVARIELRHAGDNEALRPAYADEETMEGLADTTAYCLTCHHLRGIGGEKYPEDLSNALCRWNDADLLRWIDDPGRVRAGSSMPALNRMWPDEERRKVAGRIVRYLAAIKGSAPTACPDGKK